MARRRGNYDFLGKFSYYVPGAGGILTLLALLLIGALTGSLAVFILGAVAGPGAVKEYGTLLSYPIMFIPPMLYASVKSGTASMNTGGYKLDSKHFAPSGTSWCIIAAVIGTLATGFWADGLVGLLPPMPQFLKDALTGLTTGKVWVSFLTVSIFAPLFEEWLCRGMVLRGLLARGACKPGWAIVISAVFFALIHFNPWQAVPAFLMGCLFGYVYYRTGSLRLTMLMHFTNNSFALLCGHIDALKDAEGWIDVMQPGSYVILSMACFLLTVLSVLTFRKVQCTDERGNIDITASIFGSDE